MNEIPADFIYGCDTLYAAWTGHSPADALTPEERERVRAMFPQELQEVEDWIAQDEELWNDPDYLALLEADAAYGSDDDLPEESDEQKYMAALPCQKEFCDSYDAFRTLWFKARPSTADRFGRDVAGALDVFLYEQGKSPLLTDEGFFMVYSMLDSCCKQLKSFLEEED